VLGLPRVLNPFIERLQEHLKGDSIMESTPKNPVPHNTDKDAKTHETPKPHDKPKHDQPKKDDHAKKDKK
jgi:hypothetical protein